MDYSPEENENFKLLEEATTSPVTSTKPLIQRVTHTLRARYNEGECKQYFEPISVAIGPLHHEKIPEQGSRFQIGEKFKLQLAAMFIKYSGKTGQELYNNVKKEITSLRNCYDPKEVLEENWKDEELAWMFLVDGCALLQFIFLDVKDRLKQLGGKNDLVAFAKLDLFLLENQLPYKLLEILIGTCTEVPSEGGANRQKELEESINKFINADFLSPFNQDYSQAHPAHEQSRQQLPAHFPAEKHEHQIIQVDSDQTHPHEQRQEEEEEEEEEEEPAHLLALLRRRLIEVKSKEKGENQKQDKRSPSQQLNEGLWRKLMNLKLCSSGDKNWPTFRNVKELKAKGIRFKAKENIVGITDIDFNNRSCMPTLKLAPILVDDTTMPKLLNLIAYEMCPDFKNEFEITSYVSFLDSLIHSGEDVKELRDAGVLHNGLGSDEAVAELFNKISDNLVPNVEIHKKLNRRIQEHCNRVWASDVAQICHTYFSSPWSFIVFLGAVAGLVMTGVQTYNSFSTTQTSSTGH